MEKMEPKEFLAGRNSALLSFLCGIVPHKDPHSYQFATLLLVENVYNLKNNNLVLPHNFMANLIQTFISGSNSVTAVNVWKNQCWWK